MSTRIQSGSANPNPTQPVSTPRDREVLARQIGELGEWFHNLNLHGIDTAPNHFLGDFPNIKWKYVAQAIPESLEGATVLDIGCNAGFYSMRVKERGARHVLGIDVDERYLRQARFAAETMGMDIDFQKMSVYEVDRIPGTFDYVFFMGVFYHLRYPLYALDKIVKKVGGRLIFQTMIRGSENARITEKNYHFWDKQVFADPAFPCMYFVEHSYAGDPTNWWIPNVSAAEGMLRSAGLEIEAHPEPETWIARPIHAVRDGKYIADLELSGLL